MRHNPLAASVIVKEFENKKYRAVGKRFIAEKAWVNQSETADPIASKRSLIRHDADRVARELMRIFFA